MNPRNGKNPSSAVMSPVQLEHLMAGDILLFRPSKQIWFFQQIIMLAQAFIQKEHGHYDTTHVAICIGQDAGNPKIAHVTEKHDSMGFIEETIDEMFQRDDGDRPFLAFRHKNLETANRIAEIAGHTENHHKSIRWELKNGIKALITNHEINPRQEAGLMMSLSASTICSQFAIETLKMAAREKSDIANYPNIHSTSTPKVLEGFLYQHNSFHKMCYLGQNAFETLKQKVETQLHRLDSYTDRKSRAKHAVASLEYNKILRFIDKNDDLDEMEKSLALIKAMLPIFERSTGLGLFSTTSASSLIHAARRMGIFKRDINHFSLDDISKPHDIGEAVRSFDVLV